MAKLKRVVSKSRVKRTLSGAGKRSIAKQERAKRLASLQLPTKKKKPHRDPKRFSILFYGPPKIGKSTWYSSFPNIIYLSTEPGTDYLEQDIFEFNHEEGGITSWEVMLRFVELIEKDRQGFESAVIDTADMAYEMCLDYVCANLGITYPGVTEEGVNDRGKSWNAVKKEFRRTIMRMRQAGLGVHFISHAKQEEIKTRGGDSYHRIETTMTGSARGCVEPLVSHIFYADYAKAGKKTIARVITTQGDDHVNAGGRLEFPRFLPLTRKDGYGVLMAALAGEDVGLSADRLMPSKKAFKAFHAHMTAAKRADSLPVRRVKGG